MHQSHFLLWEVLTDLDCQLQTHSASTNDQHFGRLLDLLLSLLQSVDCCCLGVLIVQVAGLGVAGAGAVDQVLVLDLVAEALNLAVELDVGLGDVGSERLDDLALVGGVLKDLGVGDKELILPALDDTGTRKGEHVMEVGVLFDDDEAVG